MASGTTTDLGPRIMKIKSNTLTLYSPNPLSLIATILVATGISFLAFIRTPVVECERILDSLRSDKFKCEAKEFMFFGIDVSKTEFAKFKTTFNDVVNPLEKVLLLSSGEKSTPETTFLLQLSNLDSSVTIEFPAGNNREKADAVVSSIQSQIENPQVNYFLISSRIGAIFFSVRKAIIASEVTSSIFGLYFPWKDCLPGIVLILGGIWYSRKPGSCFQFNRNQRKVKIKRHDLSPMIELPLDTVKAVIIEKWLSTNREGDCTHFYYRVSLVLELGEIEPLNKTYSSNLKTKSKTAEAIRDFLELPPVEIVSSSS